MRARRTMRTRWTGRVWVSLALVLAAGGLRAGDSLVVATYNLQNYNLADRRSEEGFRPAYPKPEEEKAALRAVIRSLNADVLALQEIGGPAFLAELRRDLASEGWVYPYGEAMLAADEARGLAVLSRVPLGAITAHRDLRARRRGAEEAEPVRRGMLQAEVLGADGAPGFTLFIVHLKSRLAVDRDDPQAEDQRVAEAQAVRDRVLKVFSEPTAASARFVVLGDFNDLPGSRALEAVEARGKTRIAVWTDAVDSRGHRWTHAYPTRGLYSRFDQLFVSAALGGSVRRAWIGDGPEVERASDHRPLVLELGPALELASDAGAGSNLK
jgi:endonuclease/exonuclease/phosphatase family metal-dependent hydrolase